MASSSMKRTLFGSKIIMGEHKPLSVKCSFVSPILFIAVVDGSKTWPGLSLTPVRGGAPAAKDLPFGEEAVLELMFAAMTSAAERWRAARISPDLSIRQVSGW